MSFGDDGDEGGDDESGCFILRKPPTFTHALLVLLLLCVCLKRTSMQISPSEDKIPVSTTLLPLDLTLLILTNLWCPPLYDQLS